MWSKKASLEIGVNTIVILVIAMVLLGLGIGFVRNLFSKANTLPDFIDVGTLENPPTPSEPVKPTPASIEIKAGDARDVKVGVYNKAASPRRFGITIPSCTGGIRPVVQSLQADIPSGESAGFKVIIEARNETTRIPSGKYICIIQANEIYVSQAANPTSDPNHLKAITLASVNPDPSAYVLASTVSATVPDPQVYDGQFILTISS